MQPLKRIKTVQEEIDDLKKRRDNRKYKEYNNAKSNVDYKIIDKEYEKMVNRRKNEVALFEPQQHKEIGNAKIFVVVRKRPLSRKEINNGEIDNISALNPKLIVHECKVKIDGFTKYLEDHEFYFDNTFNESETTEEIYDYTISPMIDLVLSKGIVTCFAYGQTGSGKTFTMKGIQNLAIDSLFYEKERSKRQLEFYISFFEIYGGRLYDLLNNKNRLQVFDDKNGKVQIYGLQEISADTAEEMQAIIDRANALRTTHNTVTNETSSRSHAICNITIKEKNSNEFGKLSLVDLAGSERANETQSNNRQRRAEGAEINKSLLALKECIRALEARKTSGNNEIHVPFRASKLTHVLRDSFVSKNDRSRIIMISCINPSYISSNHTINTLRYSDRLKEQTIYMQKRQNQQPMQLKASNNVNFTTSQGHTKQSLSKEAFNKVNPRNPYVNNNNLKELDYDEINVFNQRDELLNDINFDNKINLADELMDLRDELSEKNKKDLSSYKTPEKNLANLTEKEIDDELNDLIYLKKTVSKEGKFISDDFIKYHKLTDKIIEDEDDIVNTHMNVIKDDAKMLTEEGELITKIKGIGKSDEQFTMEMYLKRLEEIIDKKINLYTNLQNKLNIYKEHIKEEDQMRKEHPQFFVEPADI